VSSTLRDRTRPTEAVAGLLASLAIFAGAFELVYRPFRLAPVAVVLAIIATVMSREQPRIIPLAYIVIGVCFVAGAALQILTHHPLY
jgi:predicted homoserine dehydrogenase-like protein